MGGTLELLFPNRHFQNNVLLVEAVGAAGGAGAGAAAGAAAGGALAEIPTKTQIGLHFQSLFSTQSGDTRS